MLFRSTCSVHKSEYPEEEQIEHEEEVNAEEEREVAEVEGEKSYWEKSFSAIDTLTQRLNKIEEGLDLTNESKDVEKRLSALQEKLYKVLGV